MICITKRLNIHDSQIMIRDKLYARWSSEFQLLYLIIFKSPKEVLKTCKKDSNKMDIPL